MLRLAGVLVRQGHEVIVWAPERWRAQAEDLGACFEPALARDAPRLRLPLRGRVGSDDRADAEPLIAALFKHDVDLLIRDNQTPWALVAGQYLGIPRIVAHPMFPMFTAGYREVADGDSPPGPPDAEHEAQRARFERIWLSIARRWGVELTDVGGIVHTTSEPTLTFTTEAIVGEVELPSAWRCIGPLLPPPPAPQPRRGRPLVYTSFGTTYNRRAELFRTVISGLTREPVDVAISTGGGGVTLEHLHPYLRTSRCTTSCRPKRCSRGQASTSRTVAATPFTSRCWPGCPWSASRRRLINCHFPDASKSWESAW